MTAYEVYLVLHIGGTVVWIGTAFAMVLLGTRASLSRDAVRTAGFASDSEWLGLRLFLPANLLVLASAFLLVEEARMGYDQLWIQLGLAGFALSFLTGAAFFGPGWARVRKLAGTEGFDSPAVSRAVRRLLLVSQLDLGLLLGILFVMTIKPTADEQGALAVTAAIPAAFAVLGLVLLRLEARGRLVGRSALGAP